MKRTLLAIIVVLVLVLTGCPPRREPTPAPGPTPTSASPDPYVVQAKIANAIAVTVNETVPVLRDIESQEGDDVIHTSENEPAARMRLQEVEKRWQPVWVGVKVLRAAQDGWAKALETKGSDRDAALGAVLKAFCELSPLLPRQVPLRSLATYLCEVK
jgi:hypothetical protein